MRQGEPQRLSFIFIMRNLDATSKLDESAKSTLQRTIINLVRYGKLQLFDILKDRVALAFELGAVSEDVTDLVAELAYSELGNARFGIELLWRAGKYADSEKTGIVEPNCVRSAISGILPSLRRAELTFLGLHERLFLLAVARYFKANDEVYAALTEIEKTYGVLCEEYGETPKGHTQLWNYSQHLSKMGVLITEVGSAEIRGRTTRISLPRIPAIELEQQLSQSIGKET
jgi:archaeal cell division control protein 6